MEREFLWNLECSLLRNRFSRRMPARRLRRTHRDRHGSLYNPGTNTWAEEWWSARCVDNISARTLKASPAVDLYQLLNICNQTFNRCKAPVWLEESSLAQNIQERWSVYLRQLPRDILTCDQAIFMTRGRGKIRASVIYRGEGIWSQFRDILSFCTKQGLLPNAPDEDAGRSQEKITIRTGRVP